MNNLNDILNLSTSERLAVIRQIWESIDSSSVEITDEQKKELDIRLERVKSGETSFKSWDEVKKGLH
ncbi:MAG: addiction module protein [Flavobacteriales bacterium]|nr:addiction module protein [Flavobacteriales bacterium]|tara:strand:+ start:20260 stop:20460 length:201 start_codon:yes stop_codon:yes gene_type:complete